MDLKKLAEDTGVKERQIRLLISLKLVPPPEGNTRGATYGNAHVDAIERYKRLNALGMSAASIAKSFSTTPIDVEPIPGVRITIDPGVLPDAFDANAFSQSFSKHLSHFFKEPVHADHDD